MVGALRLYIEWVGVGGKSLPMRKVLNLWVGAFSADFWNLAGNTGKVSV